MVRRQYCRVWSASYQEIESQVEQSINPIKWSAEAFRKRNGDTHNIYCTGFDLASCCMQIADSVRVGFEAKFVNAASGEQGVHIMIANKILE